MQASEASGAFREVNDAIRRLVPNERPETWEFFCECTDLACRSLVSLTVAEFDTLRGSAPPVPVLAHHHAA